MEIKWKYLNEMERDLYEGLNEMVRDLNEMENVKKMESNINEMGIQMKWREMKDIQMKWNEI